MAKILRPGKKSSIADTENTCSYCLFFQPYRQGTRPLRGNCAYHKEWIDNATFTTCSDMSNQHLAERGIYRLVSSDESGWLYVRREKKIRTRLFSVK